MAAATKTKLSNFIGGKAVEPIEGGMEDVVNPAPRRSPRRSPG